MIDFPTSDTWKKYFENKETKILMLGLDCEGKSTILEQFHLSNHLQFVHIVGFNHEIIDYEDFKIICWDYIGDDRIRTFWKQNYFPKTNCLILVVDSSDKERLEQSIDELHLLLKEKEIRESVILVFLNKMDLPNSIIVDDFEKKLIKDLTFKIQKLSATKCEGFVEGLNWIGEQIDKKFRQK